MNIESAQGKEGMPISLDMPTLLKEFDALYAQSVPLRYAQLQPGYTQYDLEEKFQVNHIPEEYKLLYQWRNGLAYQEIGWKDEFKEDYWYEVMPLYDSSGWVSVEGALSLKEMWEEILAEKKEQQQPCFWKPGFIPFLDVQSYGLVVLDTVGYFGGEPGQLVEFDYKSGGGYSIPYASISYWLHTVNETIKAGLFTHDESIKWRQLESSIYKNINGDRYTLIELE